MHRKLAPHTFESQTKRALSIKMSSGVLNKSVNKLLRKEETKTMKILIAPLGREFPFDVLSGNVLIVVFIFMGFFFGLIFCLFFKCSFSIACS